MRKNTVLCCAALFGAWGIFGALVGCTSGVGSVDYLPPGAREDPGGLGKMEAPPSTGVPTSAVGNTGAGAIPTATATATTGIPGVDAGGSNSCSPAITDFSSGCNTCMEQNCCDETNNCLAQSACKSYVDCFKGCTDSTCQANCTTSNTAGASSGEVVTSCAVAFCSNECP